MRSLQFVILVLSLSLVVDVDAGWKFWNSKKKTTTEDPLLAANSTTTTTTTAAPAVKPASPSHSPAAAAPPNPKQGIAAAADPALAIGVGSVGDKIRDQAGNQPRRPNPGTEVGLDIGRPKPVAPGLGGGSGHQGYRDWAADLTGAGGDSGRVSPKLPSQGPALTAGGEAPKPDNRPASAPASPAGHHPSAAPGTRPASAPASPTHQLPAVAPGSKPASAPASPSSSHSPAIPGTRPASAPASPSGHLPGIATGPRPSTAPSSPTGSLDGKSPPSSAPASPSHPSSKPGSPHQTHGFDFPQLSSHDSKPNTPPGSPTNVPNKSWAEVAGGGGSRPGSPTHVNPSQPSGGSRPSSPGASVVSVGPAGAIAAGAGAAATYNAGRYSSNPTYSKGKTVTDEDLEKLSEALFIKDSNNAYKYITVNLQRTTSGSSPKDEAPEPLFQVKQEAFQIPTIQKVLSIYDNYKLDTRENEYISPAQRQEESQLIDTFLSTNVMSAAMRFLADKGLINKDYYEYKDRLRTIWFNLYSRGEGKIGSTGFEHVFMNELKLGTEVSGLHNWIYFNAEELKKRLDYLGYIKKVDLGNKAAIVKAHVKFDGHDKPVTNVFVGTSPELEMALYTVCFYTRPDSLCPVSLGGTKFNIQTYKFKYRGKDLVGSAYPEI